jgi:hypothetical protein
MARLEQGVLWLTARAQGLGMRKLVLDVLQPKGKRRKEARVCREEPGLVIPPSVALVSWSCRELVVVSSE